LGIETNRVFQIGPPDRERESIMNEKAAAVEPAVGRTGRTNWRRFGVLFGAATAVAVAMTVLMANGTLAANFVVSGQQFKVSATSLDGDGFVNYGWIDQQADRTAVPVAVTGIRHATLRNMCQSVLTSLPIVGDISLELTAGTGDTPVTADDLLIDMSQLEGDATFTNINIGQDASTLNKGPTSAQGLQGAFGQQADSVHIENLRQVAWASSAGRFHLTDLNVRVVRGRDECF
jgi:hypothetical protein